MTGKEEIVPPEHPFRTLVLCFDGTGDQFDADVRSLWLLLSLIPQYLFSSTPQNSNVVALFSMLKKDDREKQMVYYQAGIGTYTSPKVATPLMSKLSKVSVCRVTCSHY